MNKFENYPVKKTGEVFNKKIAQYGDKFCAAPWSTLIIENNSDIRFCCMADRDGQPLSTDITKAFNSDIAKAVRQNFINGAMEMRAISSLSKTDNLATTYCDKCWSVEQRYGNPHAPRVSNTDWASHVIDELVSSTDSNGYMNKEHPAWLDIRFSNKCNFACMGCDISLSTTVGKYAPAYHTRDAVGDSADYKPLTEEECLLDTVDADALIKYIIDHRDTITHIHFQGGEPFMMPEVYKTLDILLKYGMNKEDGIHIWCHTNGSIRTFKNVDIIKKYLSKWEDRFHITMSHDGMGKRGEYIRFGYRDKKWLDVFRRIKDAGPRMNIQHSINILNILHQEECLEWYHENCLDKHIGVTVQPWQSGIFKLEHISYVPELVDNAITQFENCIKFLTPLYDPWQVEEYKKYLSTLYSLNENPLLSRAADPDVLSEFDPKRFIRTITKFDEMRKTDFHKTFPELKLLWNQCIL